MRLVVALVSIAGCSGGDPSPDAELSLVPADYSSFSEVQGCRNSVDHELTKIRTLADPSTKNACLGRMPFPTGGIFIAEERDIDETTCTGPILSWSIMIKLEELGCEESIVGLVIPTGYSFNLDGTCLYLVTATVFLAQATNTHLSVAQQLGIVAVLLLTSKGAAAVSGAAFVVLASTLSTIGTIPVASIALILGIHRFMGEALAMTNLVGNSVATIVIARWEGAVDEGRLQRLQKRD